MIPRRQLQTKPKQAVNNPHDTYEREADRVANAVLSAPPPQLQIAPSQGNGEPSGGNQGRPLSRADQAFFGARFGYDFGGVRVHTDPRSGEYTSGIQARAATLGNHVSFAPGEYAPGSQAGRKLIAHELTHVIQQAAAPVAGVSQRAPGAVVQRYESGEHAQLGDARKEMQALIDGETVEYTVAPNETLDQIASRFGVTEEALKTANSAKLKTWDATDGSKTKIVGFEAGEKIVIPPVLNAETQAALKDASGTSFTVNGVTLDYGVGIAMGDFFESPEQMAKASKTELETLRDLIIRERNGGTVSTKEWEAATGNRYLKLAEKNEAHFAPSDPSLAPVSAMGGENHKTAWEKHHAAALELSQKGDKDAALQTNAFADHFLTDAFSAGHLINKLDVMELFKSKLPVNTKGEFIGNAKKFFAAVSASSFKGAVKTTFSAYETVTYEGYVFRPNINSVDRFATLLEEIHKKEPDVLSNAVAKGIHDTLNTFSKGPPFENGVPVENNVGDSWNLSGDGTLNEKTKAIALKAVAQSQLNVLGVFKAKAVPPIDPLLEKVWDFVPHPTAEGAKIVGGAVKSGTDPTDPVLVAAVSKLITENYLKIAHELESRGFLKKA